MNLISTLSNYKNTFLSWGYLSLFTLVLLCGTSAMAQRTVTGTVQNSTGDLLVGVTVIIQGTTEGAQTDTEGKFSVIVPNNDATLIFSFLGYETQEVSLNGRSTLDVTLVEEDLTTDEVVITALGIEREKKSLGYSVTEVDGDAIADAQTLSVANALQGRVAGVNITQGGSGPAGATRVVIRGNSSLTGNNQPLYVIDGLLLTTLYWDQQVPGEVEIMGMPFQT